MVNKDMSLRYYERKIPSIQKSVAIVFRNWTPADEEELELAKAVVCATPWSLVLDGEHFRFEGEKPSMYEVLDQVEFGQDEVVSLTFITPSYHGNTYVFLDDLISKHDWEIKLPDHMLEAMEEEDIMFSDAFHCYEVQDAR